MGTEIANKTVHVNVCVCVCLYQQRRILESISIFATAFLQVYLTLIAALWKG